MDKNITRCKWVTSDQIYRDYHDQEWGVPVYDDAILFEYLILEGVQAGLSWLTVLKRRENYRQSFDHFDAEKIARYDQQKFAALLQDTGIIRNRLKIQAAITNAQAYLAIKEKHASFSDYMWQFVGSPKQNNWKSHSEVPAETTESQQMSKELKKAGFKFVGSTICYAFMQAVGMVNDHLEECFRHKKCSSHAGLR